MSRVLAIDWLRGIAVLVMIQTHALVLLKPERHADPLFSWLVRIDGLVAPSFIFCAGFALALVQCRAALSGQPRLASAKKSLRRISEVLLAATFVNFVWFPLLRQPKWLLRIDILHCIGLSLLLALPLIAWLSKWPKMLRWVLLLCAGVIFGFAPLFEKTPGLLGVFLNSKPGFLDDTTGTVFPLLPWAGYAFLGASTGATVSSLKREKDFWAWLGLIAGLGALLWSQQAWLSEAYPPHSFWVTNPANAAQRWTLVVLLLALLRLIERTVPSVVNSKPVSLLAAFSTSSLSAYVFHQMLLYQRFVGVFTRFWREQCDWPLYWGLVIALIAATWLCVKGWNRLEPTLRRRLPA